MAPLGGRAWWVVPVGREHPPRKTGVALPSRCRLNYLLKSVYLARARVGGVDWSHDMGLHGPTLWDLLGADMRKLGAGQTLGAAVHNLARARYRSRQAKAELLEEWAAEVIGPGNAAQLALAFAAQTPDPDADRWIFVMINPAQNFAVMEWLGKHSKRPQVAVSLWALLLTALRMDTGEILLSRGQIADRIGIAPKHVSEIITELAGINALRRVKQGRAVRYFLNPHIATHIPGPEARKAAREAAGPLLVLMEGGKAQI